MRQRAGIEWILIFLRAAMGLWFIWLGIEKLFVTGPVIFSQQVTQFEIFVNPWNLWIAYLVPWLELLCGIILFLQVWPRAAVRVLVALSVVFLFVNWQALARGLNPDCGCFGNAFQINLGAKIYLIFGQLAILVVMIVGESRVRYNVFRGKRMRLPE